MQMVVKSALAGLMAFLLLSSVVLAASPSLHRLVHVDSATGSHLCAVCLLAQGQVNSAADAPVIVAFAFSLFLLVVAARPVIASQLDHRWSPSRAPPCFSSSRVR